ncbi:hypothetical protein M0802_013570 [Mischocyttarus mexicanus]|nr:hypothetical protein M0802_013574 [Mischocyttarus mexicanus]KAI4482950.1 hypothetical protein M0802_013570 [Mischocyttarus mexicanus]
MLYGYADGVKEHEDDDEPIEILRFHGITYPESEPLLGLPKFYTRSFVFHLRLEVGRSREPYKRYNFNLIIISYCCVKNVIAVNEKLYDVLRLFLYKERKKGKKKIRKKKRRKKKRTSRSRIFLRSYDG